MKNFFHNQAHFMYFAILSLREHPLTEIIVDCIIIYKVLLHKNRLQIPRQELL